MQTLVSPSVVRYANSPLRPDAMGLPCAAFNEYELAHRWGLSVKTLRRWRQQQRGPIFCKLGARITYLLSDIEAYERRVARYSTFARAYPVGSGA